MGLSCNFKFFDRIDRILRIIIQNLTPLISPRRSEAVGYPVNPVKNICANLCSSVAKTLHY